MASSTNLEVLRGDGAPDDGHHRLDLAIDALKARVDREFQITERLDAKARQSFALVAAVFAVAQAVAFGGFRANKLATWELIVLAAWAGVSAVLVALSGHFLGRSEALRPARDIKPEAISRWAKEKDDVAFARQMIVELTHVAESRHEDNELRRARYRSVALVSWLALIVTAIEILFAIGFRA